MEIDLEDSFQNIDKEILYRAFTEKQNCFL